MTQADLIKLDYAFDGEPFCNLSAESLNTLTLDYPYSAEPFVGLGRFDGVESEQWIST
jgi:hypothetical protein